MSGNIDQYGVQTTVQGFNTFIVQMGAAANATQKLGLTITNTARQVNSMSNVGDSMTTLPSVASAAGGAMAGFGAVLGRVFTIAAGILAAQVFRRIGQEILSIVSGAFAGATAFETLTVRLETLAARQLRAADSSLTMDESLQMASKSVQGYLRWIKLLALETPFGTQDIAQLFTLAQAYNFTAVEAKNLTEAIVNFASGMGLTGVEMTRIIENFGQMRAAGKVTGTELRDLARGAFVPVNDVLRIAAENLGYTVEEIQKFREEAAKGAVSVDEFVNAFIELAEQDFAGSAERMSRTWAGVTERVKDFIETVIGVEVLGPLVSRFAEVASGALDTLVNEETLRNATLTGLALARSFDEIWAAISGRLIPALQNLAAAFGFNIPTIQEVIGWIAAFTSVVANTITIIADFIDNVGTNFAGSIASYAEQAYGWGVNIIFQLAQGIIYGGANLLVQAMQWIGRVLSSWLQPGSPPKVAQDILKWGAGTFEEYLKGFAKADFGILDSLQSPLKTALDILTQVEAISEEDSASMFANISEAIAAAIEQFKETGQVDTDVFAGLNSQAGAFGDELQTLLELELAYAGAVQAVEQAQEALNAAQEAQKTAQGQVKSLTQEYNAMLRAGADESILRTKLAEINAAEQARNAAVEQRRAAEQALENAEDALDPIKAQVDAQKELIEQLLELARIQAGIKDEQPAGGTDTGGGGGGGGGGTTGGGFEFPPLDPMVENFDEFFNELQRKFNDKMRLILEGLLALLREIIAMIIEAWNNLMTTLREALENSPLVRAWANVFGQMWILVQNIWGLIMQFVTGGINTLIALWNEHAPRIGYIWDKTWKLVQRIVVDTLTFVGEELGRRLEEINAFFEEHEGTFGQIVDNFWYLVYHWADFWLDETEIAVNRGLTQLGGLWELAKTNILPKVSTLWASISLIIGTIMGSIVRLVAGLLNSLRNFWEEHGGSVRTIVSKLFEFLGYLFTGGLLLVGLVISTGLDYLKGYWDTFGWFITELVDVLLQDIQDIWDAGLDLVGAFFDIWAAIFTGDWEGFWNGIKDWFTSYWNLVKELFTGALDAVLGILWLWIGNIIGVFMGLWNTLVGNSIIPDMLDDIETAFQTALDAISKWIDEHFIQPALEAWQTFMDDLKTKIDDAKTTLQTAFENVFNAIKTALEDIWADIQYAFYLFMDENLLQTIQSFLANFYTVGKNLIMSLINGATSQGSALFNALKALVVGQLNKILAALGLPTIDVGGAGGSGDGSGGGGGTAEETLRIADYAQAVGQAALARSQARTQAPMVVNNYNLHFETTINSGMDAAEYKAFVKKTIDGML